MRQETITQGTRQVVIWSQQDGRWEARLYVNKGETATLQTWKGKTEAGARQWADKILGK